MAAVERAGAPRSQATRGIDALPEGAALTGNPEPGTRNPEPRGARLAHAAIRRVLKEREAER